MEVQQSPAFLDTKFKKFLPDIGCIRSFYAESLHPIMFFNQGYGFYCRDIFHLHRNHVERLIARDFYFEFNFFTAVETSL